MRIEVPGPQGPGYPDAVLYGREQELTEEEKARARLNIGAAKAVQTAENNGFSFRFTENALDPKQEYSLDILKPKKFFKEGDMVLDGNGTLYMIASINGEATFTTSDALSQFVKRDELGKLAFEDEVTDAVFANSIDLGTL